MKIYTIHLEKVHWAVVIREGQGAWNFINLLLKFIVLSHINSWIFFFNFQLFTQSPVSLKRHYDTQLLEYVLLDHYKVKLLRFLSGVNLISVYTLRWNSGWDNYCCSVKLLRFWPLTKENWIYFLIVSYTFGVHTGLSYFSRNNYTNQIYLNYLFA